MAILRRIKRFVARWYLLRKLERVGVPRTDAEPLVLKVLDEYFPL